ncbi:mucin-5AC [Paralichthys olivaceus]|uniref:mucin-5AC n=1 Tax=Paralichthys olivaceus TaxID=8255 RepID=UPI00375334EC
MPTAKDKGGSASHRHHPASEYDDASLAQKREYWRTKKREQRARLSERRGKPAQYSRGKKLLHLNTTAVVDSSLSGSLAAPSSPVQSNDESYKTPDVSPASHSANALGVGSLEAPESQKPKWFHTMKLDKVLPQFPASCSLSAKAASGNTATLKCRTTRGAVNRAVTSPTASGTQLNSSSSVPLVRVTRITNGSSAQTTPQPRVSMQGTSVLKMQHKQHVASHSQPKLSPTNVAMGRILVSSPCGPISIKTEGKEENTTPPSGTKSALVTTQRAKGVGNSQPSIESEEERAARRREHWRIKKREQRAKLAAQIAKARDRTQATEMTVQRQMAQKTRHMGPTARQHLPSQSFLEGAGPTQAKATFRPAKKRNDKLQIGAASLATVNLQIKVQNPHETRKAQTAIASDVISVRKSGETLRRFPSYVHLSNVTRGIVRCKTPRQRFIEAQRSLMIQRNMRCKSPLLASVFGTRNIPRIDPNDTPEQIIAKRREYWRIKKREQRAKLSLEVRARLKERDSLMRRVKRYQNILEEMRKARALTQSAGSTLTHASETIGGFIKEDGTVTIKIPQVSTCHNTASRKSEEELHVQSSSNTHVTQPQYQPHTRRRGVTPVRINQPFCPAQVKVSFPLSGKSVNKHSKLLSARARTQRESTTVINSHSPSAQAVGQLTLTHPQTRQNAISGGSRIGSNLGSCVMKMAVSSSAESLALSLDPGLTEEERMAKKREYWRIKKREQRAARAARLKQGVLQARANAALQRRKAQKQVALNSAPLSKRLSNPTENAQPPPDNSVPVTPNANEIKQETESVPAVDLNSQPEQAICPDIKRPTSPPLPSPPPAPQPESDPALSADSQATTLRAVASMKKLLEESLSTVRDCKSQQPDMKTEPAEEASEQEMKPNLPQLFFEEDEVAPLAANLTLQIKSWQPDTDAPVHSRSPSPHFKNSPQISETPSPIPTSSDVILLPTCEHASQTSPTFTLNPSMEDSDGPSSPRRTQRLRAKKVDHQDRRSPEPPELHHLPVGELHPQQEHGEQQCQAQEECQNSMSPSAQRYHSVGTELVGLTSLQRKREYWKLMKRQQRARLKARQKDRQGGVSSRQTQAPGFGIFNNVKRVNPQVKPALKSKSSIASLAVSSIPALSPTTCHAEQSPHALQLKLPVLSVSCSPRSEQNNTDVGPSQIVSRCLDASENQQQAMPRFQISMSPSTDVDSACLPTLMPPDNPLSSINLQPIEPHVKTSDPTLSAIKIPSQLHSPSHMMHSPCKLVPVSTMAPPKPIPGESEEDFLRRKREYWRIKKKEQRARKAIQDKAGTTKRVAKDWRPILPAQDALAQDSGQWLSSSDESEHLMSTSVDTDQESFPYPNYTAPEEDDPELLFTDYENNSGEEGSISDGVWRYSYLMDYDPLNQLLVCMVCGELQYSHSLEGVRAHIDDAHPDTLTLEAAERRRILEAWDEQVSQRERFFTSQLQQHSGTS